MSQKERIDWDAVDRLLEDPRENFVDLAQTANLDPATDFINADLRFVNFGRCDLAGYNFKGANLEGATLAQALVEDAIWEGTKNKDKATWPSRYEQPGLEEEASAFPMPPAPAFDQYQLAEDPTPFHHNLSIIDDLPPPPAGWRWIDKAWLDGQRQPLSEDDLGRFFDGIIPDWHHALSEKIPRRDVVLDSAKLLQAAADLERPRVVFLKGAGGEGKSTAIRQIVAQLLEDDPRWRVLWRRNDLERMVLPKDFATSLPDDGAPILIATDEADNIARNLLAFVEAAREQDRDRLHVLIAARDTDWQASDPQQQRWEEITDFRPQKLQGVSEADAGKIYDAWLASGSGLGELAGMSRGNAVRRPVQLARDEEETWGDGALLGAMIELRMAEGFKPYVKKLLNRLDGIPAPGGHLGGAYSYIAAMHAENLRFLSSPVLAHVLGCDEPTLRKEVIRPLADEAAGHSQGSFILTRHRRIAEMAIELIEEDGEDRFEMLAKLAEAAVQTYDLGSYIPELGSWRFGIVERMLKVQRTDDGVRLARRLMELEPANIQSLVNLARTLRETGKTKAAVDVFREAPDTLARDRVFYYEWGTVAGNAGDQALSVWLDGVSLSDADGLPRLEADQVKLSLSGLGVACKEIPATSGDQTFLRARGAAGQLGLSIPGIERDVRACRSFRRGRDEAEAAGVDAMSVDVAIQAIEDAVFLAHDLAADRDDLVDEGVPYPDEMAFISLRKFPWQKG